MQSKFTFHAGERTMQSHSGQAAMAERNSAMIADTILGAAREFIQSQFMVVLASVDAEGAVWSSIIYGQAGFIRAESDSVLMINVPVSERDNTDPFWANIATNPAVGILLIELATRRRYRINGSLQHMDDQGIEIVVHEAYPNCPKYIQRRELRELGGDYAHGDVNTGAIMDGKVEALIRGADTLFIATNYAEAGADASHRGGDRGFVQLVGPHTLRIPDYHGNSMFNTLGNIALNPQTGLCIPDFNGQQLLQLTGQSRILLDQDDPDNLTGGTRRFLEFDVERWILRPVPQKMAWEYVDASRYNPAVAVA